VSAAALDAERVLHELSDLWRGLGKDASGGVLRACAMTVLVLAEEEDDPQSLGATVAALMREHPSRAILLRRTGAGEPEARATVQCWLPFGGRTQICSEQIEILAPRGRVGEVLPVVFGTLVADLPVVIWATRLATAMASEIKPLLALAEKFVVDTSGVLEAGEALAALERLRGARRTVADLAWTRITRWREVVRSLFNTPSCRGRSAEIETTEVEWNGAGVPSVACYLAAWLSRCCPGTRTAFRRASAETEAPEGRLRSLRLRGPDFDLRLERPAGPGVDIAAGELATRAIFLPHDPADLLREELSILGRDVEFEAVLPLAKTMATLPVEEV
jgi:glucose-6-phosphate dehydrogenase assembly protein OpcA